jgi:poly(A) polymerase
MQQAGRIDPQPWMTAPETTSVLDALAKAGATARFVGGCVRDAVLGRPVKDIDIATDAEPDAVLAALRAAGIRAIPTGVAHGTVTAISTGRPYEITTLRHDVETFGRHARVAFTDDWAQDAARRDLTLNALYADADGALFDPVGGLDDLKSGHVRFVGAARERIEEDVLRLLRFFRFFAWYGQGPAAVLAIMSDHGVLDHVLAEATRLDRLAALCLIEAALGRDADPVLRLAAAIEVDGRGAEAAGLRLRLSNADRGRLVRLAAPEATVSPDMDERARRVALYRLGRDIFTDLALIGWAEDDVAGWRDQLAAAEAWEDIALPVGGKDVMALGVEKGPAIGSLLNRLEAWWIAEDFRPGRAACLEKLEALAKGRG